MRITWNIEVNAPGCPGEILADDGRSVLVQLDWDYPAIATLFGWSVRQVQMADCPECGEHLDDEERVCLDCGALRLPPCDHDDTDGTISCPDCGITASQFLEAAYDYLLDNDGASADDPGYFA